eukprot:CAMPEP_0198307588 /NCGR_PEP_ID=MMETSP1450-20131203/429_1 /TAXON_ID=753684 ORGANISM="Madagascaria erythrocladiodes, Strain CCMP3234" /NCGR_SAMPLE_ID=MMETSP1450 /ASSEMBLY_ACC=CAM_ASM_001115 /LENGTH=151 /DNA_ID=CAMNT_0044010175 /DNA_START=110 /DNA_END=565 /DNA_ORIENTATION=-
MAFVTGTWLAAGAPVRDRARCAPRSGHTRVSMSSIPSSPAELLRRYNTGSDAGTRTAVLERPVETAPPRAVDPERKFRVILMREGATFSVGFVAETITKVVPEVSGDQARKIAETAAKLGKATVGTWVYEIAEMYADLLRSNGLRSDIVEE